ncbi:MAG: chemotaxis protein CheD [Polaromonas sp.]
MAKLKELIDIFLQPGEYFVADAAYQIRTMLGSCVSITLWHPATRIGAMSHFLLPERSLADVNVAALDARYGDEALTLMLAELERAGIRPAQCQGKIFGGGNMFPRHARSGAQHVGRKNGEAARALLIKHDVPIVSESLFGTGHRQIIFDVSNGDVWSHQVRLSAQEAQAEGTFL